MTPARGRYAVVYLPAPPPNGDVLVLVDMDEGECWFPVSQRALMNALADRQGKWLSDLRGQGVQMPPEADSLCVAPLSWLKTQCGPADFDGLTQIARAATHAAIQQAGHTLQ